MDWRLTLVLALGISCSQGSVDRAYTPDREYIYQYEAQLATGIPENSNFYSGLKIVCEARFQFRTVSRVTMKMDKVRLYKLNDAVEKGNPTREQLTVYEELTGTEVEWMLKYLIKPVTFKYLRGHILEIKGEEDDDLWSMNVKRGLLSLLEMNFEERRTSSSKDRLVEINRDRSSPVDYYRVMEPSVVGDCETSYHIETNVPNGDEHVMHLTKVKNYLNCLERPVYYRSMFNPMRCAQCESERTEPFKSAAQFEYVLKGDKKRFMVYSVIGESQHLFTPYSPQGGNVATYINQRFVLTNQKDIESPISAPKSPKAYRTGLQADVQKDQQKPSPLTKQPSPEERLRTPKERKERIMKYIDMIVTFSKDEITPEATSMTFTLADEMRYADSDVIRAIWGEYKSGRNDAKSDKYYKWKLMLDTLPMLGTPAAVEVLTDYIRKSDVSPEDAMSVLNTLTVNAYPDINIARYMLELVRDQNVRTKIPIMRSAYLTLGAIADRIRNRKEREHRELEKRAKQLQELKDKESKKYVKDQLKSRLVDVEDEKEQLSKVYSPLKMEFIQEVRTMLKESNPEYIYMALKTIGNAGFYEFIPDCKAILSDKSRPQIIRAQSIYALRKITYYAPEAVRMLLMPFYFNQEEIEEVRLASYLVITGTGPSRPFLEMIAQSLWNERNPHVGTFVYSHLEQLANSTHPCLMSWARNATFALRFAKRFNPSYYYSQFFHFSKYYDMIKTGAAMELGYITSPQEYIPRSGALHTNVHILGRSTNVMEIGFSTEGLQKIVRELSQPSTQQEAVKSIMDILQRKPQNDDRQSTDQDSLKPSKRVKDIHKQLKVDPRESPNPSGHVYFKLFNNEIRYFDLRELLAEAMSMAGKINRKMDVNYYKSTMFMDGQYSWFTELGFPIHYKLKATTAYKVGGSWNMNMQPAQMKFDVTPSWALQMRGVVETDFYYFKSGAAITSKARYNSPLEFSFGMDSDKFTYKMDFSKMTENYQEGEMSPTFFVERHYLDATKPPFEDLKYLEQMEGTVMRPVNWQYGKNEYGLSFGVKGQWVDRGFDRSLPFYPFYGRNHMYYTLKPGNNPPTAAEFQFKYMSRESRRDDVSSQESVEDSREQIQRDDDSRKGIISGFMSYLIGSQQPKQQRKRIDLDSDRLRPISKDPRSRQSTQDSMRSSKQQSSKEKSSNGPSYGFNFKVIGVGSKPERWFSFESYCTPVKPWMYNFDMKYSRTPFTEMETKQYNVDFKGSLRFPDVHVEPESLLDKSYQRKNIRMMQKFIQEHGGEVIIPKLLELQIQSTSRRARGVQSLARNKRVLKSLVEDIAEQSKDSPKQDLQSAIELLKEQKEICRQLKKEAKQRHSVLDASSRVSKVKDLKEKLLALNERLSREVEKTPTENKQRVILKYVALRQQESQKRLSKVIRNLKGSVTEASRKDLEEQKDKLKKSVEQLLQKQSDQPALQALRQDKTSSEVRSLEKEQRQILKDVSDSSKQPPKHKLERLIKETKDVVSKVASRDIDQKTPSQVPALVEILIQHHQIIEALKQSRSDKPYVSDDRRQQPSPKELIRKLREQSKYIDLVIQLDKERQEQDELEKSYPRDVIDKVKRVSKLRLQQIKVAVEIPRDEPIRSSRAQSLVQKLEEITRQTAEEADDISSFSLLISKLRKIIRAQVQLLDKVKRSSDKSDKSLLSRIDRDIISNVDVEGDLIERVKASTNKRSTPRSSYEAKKLISEIKLDQKSIKELHKKSHIDNQPLAELLKDVVQKTRMAVDSSLRLPEKAEVLKEIKRIVKKQESVIQDVSDKLSLSVRQKQKSELKKLKDEVQTLLQQKSSEEQRESSEVRGSGSRPVESDQDSAEVRGSGSRPLESSESVQRDESPRKQKSEERVDVPSEIQRLSREVKTSISEAERKRPQQAKIQSIKEAVRKVKDVISIASSHRQSSIPQSELQSVAQQLDRLDVLIQSDADVAKDQKSKSRQSAEVKVLKDELQEILTQSGSHSEYSEDSRQISDSTEKKPREPKDYSNYLNIDITFGYDGATPYKITFEGMVKKSLEQLYWETKQISTDRDELVQRYLDEKDSPVAKLSQTYQELKRELNVYRHYHWIMKYNKHDLEPSFRMFWWRFMEYLKYNWYPHASFDMPKFTTDRFELMMNIRRNNRQVDLAFFTPLETDRFTGLNLPWNFLRELSIRVDRTQLPESIPRQAPLLSAAKKVQGECVLRDRSIKTLDRHVMELSANPGSCEIVLAMDCSSAAKFAIKSRKDERDPKIKIVTIEVASRKIELEESSRPVIRVDGVEKTVREGQPIEIPRQQSQPKRDLIARISRQGEQLKIEIPKEEVQIILSKDQVRIQVSTKHYSKMCGLCGNYDGIPHNDRENPQKLQHKSPSCVIADNVLPSPKCDIKPIQDQCKKEQPKSPEACKPQQRNLVKTRQQSGKRQVCFSVEPVKECKPGCREVKPRGQRVDLKCLDEDRKEAQQLLSQSHHRPLPEIKDLSVPKEDRMKADVKEPYSCKA